MLLAQIALTAAISKSGIGPVKFGMTPAQASAAGVTLEPDGASGGSCYFLRAASPKGVSFMVRDGKIVRGDVIKPAKLKTVDGFRFGDVEGNISGFYAATQGGVSDEPLKEDSDITVIASPEFSSGASLARLVYELNDNGVFAIHAGYVPRGFNPHGCK